MTSRTNYHSSDNSVMFYLFTYPYTTSIILILLFQTSIEQVILS